MPRLSCQAQLAKHDWHACHSSITKVLFFSPHFNYLFIHLLAYRKVWIDASMSDMHVSRTNEQCRRRGQQEHYILENFYWTKLFDFSLELLSLHLEEKLIELCPGYDMFVFSPLAPSPSTEVLEKWSPQGFEIHFLRNDFFLSCFLLFPLPQM